MQILEKIKCVERRKASVLTSYRTFFKPLQKITKYDSFLVSKGGFKRFYYFVTSLEKCRSKTLFFN